MSLKVIPIKTRYLLFKNYSYLVYNSLHREAIVVDPAWEIKKIERLLTENQLTLTSILLTHTHFDHISLVTPLVKKYNCQVFVSQKEMSNIEINPANIYPIISEVPFEIAQLKIIPLLTPGHSNGSICYLIDNKLFTGDTLFIEGCGACFGADSDPKQLFNSIIKLKNFIDPSTIVYPSHSFGHSPGLPFSFLLKENIYLCFEEGQEEMFISFRMREKQSNLFNFQ